MNRFKKAAAIGVTAFAVFASTPAMATDMWSATDETDAWSYGTNEQVAVRDRSADGDEAYAEYYYGVDAFRREVRNTTGGGTVKYGPSLTNSVNKLRACDEEDFVPDACAGWSYR
ncbi:hypothetical protein ACGFYQ_33290 [Streptomyces sp. NPDC048258]|uniref:hypothetical protein n=1 Tax=Streptomyces sp. NPDC048258 TaxID=3365527 RepID=UPI003723DCF4